jgi:hypothetical protein
MNKSGNQTFNGKEFGYALLTKIQQNLEKITTLSILESTALSNAEIC